MLIQSDASLFLRKCVYNPQALVLRILNICQLNLETLASDEMNLANLSLCLICGRNFNVETTHNGMIDINTLIDIPGKRRNHFFWSKKSFSV